MGAYWGSCYVAVTTDLETSRVEQMDFKPDGVDGTSDKVSCLIPDHLEKYEVFDDSALAKQVVRRHIWLIANEQILELVAGIEHTKLQREFIRDIEPASDDNQRRVDALTDSLAQMTAELKRVRGIKRAPIRVV